ncbi:MAG: D-2-hydroxyacid dehydrogenase [Chloroflexi bacterium]|nr:D-2-hydroxyacid dehydrogenase [Chloroflexota bacterium]
MTESSYTVLIASYLEPEHVKRIRQVDPRLRVLYEPELLRPPRYPADHHGQPRERSLQQEARWRSLLAQADILLDFDHTHHEDLPTLAPNVRWLQATSAGIGQFVKAQGYDQRMPKTTFTTASGIHAQPLAEFCLMAMLMFEKGLLRMVQDQARKHWERYAGTDLHGRTLAIVGMGKIGREVARVARAFGMTVIGANRSPRTDFLDQFYPLADLHKMLQRAEYLVLSVPHTPFTERMIGQQELAALPKGAILINVARGAVVDEPALIAALQSGHLRGAALDVFAQEPLPPDSPLWEMPNVLVSPHSASTSDRENERITDLFCENLRRYLNGQPLLNVLNTQTLY